MRIPDMKTLFRIFLVGLAVFIIYQLVLILFFSQKASQVFHLIDPDTLIVKEDGQVKYVRLIGLDAPERTNNGKTFQCFSREALIRASRYFTLSREVFLEKDTHVGEKDIHNRDLRYIRLKNGVFLNEVLLQEGLAKIYDDAARSHKYKESFLKAEQEAKKAQRGLWNPSGCNGSF